MNLRFLCEQICCNDPNMLAEDNPIGSRIMCPEYSLSLEERKTYPLSPNERIFALCWVMKANNRLYGTIKPSTLSFSYSCSFEPGDRTQLHTHEYLELAYVISGSFHQRILGRDIIFRQGDLCLIDKNCIHQDCFDSGDACVLFLGIANEMFERIMSSHVAAERIVSFLQSALLKQKNLLQYLHFRPNQPSNDQIELCLQNLLQELICHDEASSYICHGLLMRIFRLLSTCYDFSLSRELQKEMNWLLYEEITKYIKTNFQDISLKQLTEHFHFQEDYFNRLLKSKTGTTYTEYLQNLRISEAERLLMETNLSIERISEQIGYHNKGYFYKIFTEKHKMTPAKFRKENRSS